MIEVVLASNNQAKLRELHRLLADARLQLISMKDLVGSEFDVEETGATFEENAWIKAHALALKTGKLALADDSGLEVDALDSAPGVYSARYAGTHGDDAGNNRKLLQELEGVPMEKRTARFVCVLALALPTDQGVIKVASVRGELEGRIGLQAQGENGFGYDPYFYPLSDPERSTAALSPEEKNEISHRALAAQEMAPRLSRLFDDLQAEAQASAAGAGPSQEEILAQLSPQND